MKSLVLSPTVTKPTDALELPTGRLALGVVEVNFSPENVVEAAKLVIGKGGVEDPFVSQAGIIAYAGNNLGWGAGAGYQTV